MTHQVTIYNSTFDGWLDGANPAYMRFKALPSRENAVKTAEAIENLRELYWHESGSNLTKPAFSEGRLFARCPELELIQDLAELAKHGGRLRRGNVKVKAITGSGHAADAAPQSVVNTFGNLPSGPVCTLQLELIDGTTRDVPEVLERAMLFWRAELN
jgi:hypothetical protein